MFYRAARPNQGLILLVTALTFLMGTLAQAEWSHDPATNNLLAYYNNYAYEIEAVEDGSGGMIVAWRTSSSGILAQRFDADGNKLWGSQELLWLLEGEFLNGYTGEDLFHLVADGQGGAHLVWQYPSEPLNMVKAQHFDASGQPTWAEGGVPMAGFVYIGTAYSSPNTAGDNEGGLFITWVSTYGGENSILVQHLDPNGELLYSGSTLASDSDREKDDPCVIASNDSGECVVAWQERSSEGDWDIMSQKKSSDGVNQWTNESQMIFIASSGNQTAPRIAMAASGRCICVAEDDSQGHPGYRLGQVSSSGYFFASISSMGKPWYGQFDQQEGAKIVRDGAGNVLLTCVDRDEFGGGRIAAQFFPALDSTYLWGDYGRTLFLNEYQSPGLTALSPRLDESFAVIYERNAGSSTYEVQSYDISGFPSWSDDRGPFTLTTILAGTEMILLPSGHDGFLAVWSGKALSSGSTAKRPHGQFIDAQGFMGDNSIDMISVEDRPQDQGGELWVSWSASPLDNSDMAGVTSYSLWIDEADKAACWTYAGSIPAVFESAYSAFVPSLGDSTETGPIMTSVRVIAHSDDPAIFWTSASLEGYSVDNLAPGMPQDLMGMEVGGLASLEWTASGSHDEDLAFYRVYRGSESGFVPGQATLVGTSATVSYLDESAQGTAYYRVTAVDVHGNESDASDEVMVQMAASAAGDLPAEFRHHGNYPNPFNPMTRISFDLPAAGPVRVTVFDMGGRLVQTLVEETLPAGTHQVLWNGQDSAGRAVSSGVYFSRVEAGGEMGISRMTLVR